MNLVIIGLKPSVIHENNRNMFVVIFVGQASYDSPINVMKYAQNSWKDGNEINECSLFYLFVCECNNSHAYAITVSRRETGYHIGKPVLIIYLFKQMF